MAMTAIIRPRRDTKANLNTANPILKEGEMIVEFEEAVGVGQPSIKFGKVGGSTRYNDTDYAVLPIKHDTKDGWSSANHVLEKGEMGVEWETAIGEGAVCIKFGDGTTAWNDLEYASTDRLKEIIEPSGENEVLAVGDTLPVIAGKLNNQQEFLKTKLGYDRLDALAAKLSGLSNQDFVGIMDFISEKKFDKSNLYNGLDSDNPNLALSAPMGKSLSTKLGTGNLPTGMSNVIDGLTQLNSNMNALTDSSISIPSGSPVTGNRVNAKIYQNSFLVLSGEVDIDFTNLKNWNVYNILQCSSGSKYTINFIATDENGGSYHMRIETNGITKLSIRGYIPENKSQILRFFCIAPLMPA